MYGAILGDIIGSPYEFANWERNKDFELFDKHACFTDDTVMTVAIAEALLNCGKDSDENTYKKAFVESMQKWGLEYINAGYGGLFYRWLLSKNPQPYGSFGNGSAMRVSPIGWMFDSLERTREVAKWSALVTHNHPEGIKGAEATASIIWLARNGALKREIKEFIENEFDYDLSRHCEDIRPGYKFDVSCQGSVPEAIIAFLDAENYEDCIRNAVSLGGDTDTQACIAGGIAEAFYGVPSELVEKAEMILTKELNGKISEFYRFIGKNNETGETKGIL